MRISFAGASVFLLLLFLLADEAEAALRVVAFVYPPFRISAAEGLDNEIFHEACRAAGLSEPPIEIYPPARARAIFGSDPDSIYIATDAAYRALADRNISMFPIRPVRVFQYHLKSSFPGGEPTSAADFKGKTMGFYSADPEAGDAYLKRGCRTVALHDNRLLYRMLLAGRFDLMISVELAAETGFSAADPRWRSVIGDRQHPYIPAPLDFSIMRAIPSRFLSLPVMRKGTMLL